jgi:fatty acid-binding protein DegV
VAKEKMVNVIKKSDYNPSHLPKAIDFNLATKDLPLTREQKTKFQIYISKLNFNQTKQIIKDLEEMRYDAMRRNDYKMSAYCKSVKEFAEKYFESCKKQKVV